MMTTKVSVNRLNRLARDPTLPRHAELGVDAEGYVHHLDRATQRVYRIRDGERERVAELAILNQEPGVAVESYIHGYVGAQIGWHDRRPTTRDLFDQSGP